MLINIFSQKNQLKQKKVFKIINLKDFSNFAMNIVKEKNIDGRVIQKYYYEAIKDNNLLAIYEILNVLLRLSMSQEFNIISV